MEIKESVRKDINKRVTQAKQLLSGAEDELASQQTICKLWNPTMQPWKKRFSSWKPDLD